MFAEWARAGEEVIEGEKEVVWEGGRRRRARSAWRGGRMSKVEGEGSVVGYEEGFCEVGGGDVIGGFGAAVIIIVEEKKLRYEEEHLRSITAELSAGGSCRERAPPSHQSRTFFVQNGFAIV